MSYVRIWVHIVFTTKNREPILTSEFRKRLINHIRSNAKAKYIFIESIGGWSEHLHLLISLRREQTVSNIAKLIKGESAHWFNKQGFIRGKFHWQDDYFALSVSESLVDRVKKYIEDQERHHASKPFAEELNTLQRLMEKRLG